jgi:hypothetical protein
MKAAILTLTVIFALAAPAFAAEQTRESYVASVEPICKVNSQTSDKYLKGVSSLVKEDKLKPAATNFTKAAAALEKARKQLTGVPQPPADAAKLTQWLAGINAEASLMRQIATKLRSGAKGKASSLSVKLQHNATQTNNLVIAFSFDYCRIDPSQYA